MNEVLKALKERRSVRDFTDEDVSEEDLKTILETAAYAPTARNSQAWHATAVRGLDKIAVLNEAVKKANQKPGYERYKELAATASYSINFRQAPVFILVGVDREKSVCQSEDGALVIGYILLAAHSLGLGACWINQLGVITDEPEFRESLNGLGFPPSHRIIGCVALGHRKKLPPVPTRRLDHYNIVA
ncbi:MAG: nitroreductase family protein [Deltaproteobacteria bacterium]|jgi:nitroreductase|nr:nitroreductase family protein [Deltaproteobacteria bacterium]